MASPKTILLISGFFRSLQFTALNALAFADMRPEDLSQATSVSGTAQQVAQSLALQLLFSFEMSATRFGLVGASPE